MVRRPGRGSRIVMHDCTHGASSHQWRFARPRCGSHRQRVEPKHYPVVVVAAAGSFWCHQATSGLRAVPRLGRRGAIPLGGAVETGAGYVAVSSDHSRRWYQHVLAFVGASHSRLRSQCTRHRTAERLSLHCVSAHRGGHRRLLTGSRTGNHAGRGTTDRLRWRGQVCQIQHGIFSK